MRRVSRRLALLLVGVGLIVLTSVVTSQGHKLRPGDCSVGSNPKLAGKDVPAHPDYDFRWESSASSKAGSDGKWCYDRYVVNNHDINPLRYDWPLANLGSRTGLPPRSKAPRNLHHVNFPWESGPAQQVDGYLTYGMNQREWTRVYLTPEEAARAGLSTTANILLYALDEKGKTLTVDLTLGTTFDEGKKQITYTFRSRSNDPVAIGFHPVETRVFYDSAVMQVKRKWAFGEPMPLQEGLIRATLLSKKGVAAAFERIRFFSATGTEIAYVGVPLLLPRR